MKAVKEEFFAVIRFDNATHEEFVDLSTVAYSREGSQIKSRDAAPGWKENNPQRRIARFTFSEVVR